MLTLNKKWITQEKSKMNHILPNDNAFSSVFSTLLEAARDYFFYGVSTDQLSL